MNRWWYSLLALLLMVFCADRISPTNVYDPLNTNADYNLSLNIPDTLVPFARSTFKCTNEGGNNFESFTFLIEPGNYSIINPTPDNRYEFDDKGISVNFTDIDSFTLSITAQRKNGIDTTYTFPFYVSNPYSIEIDSGALLLGNYVTCSVINSLFATPPSYDTSLRVRWRNVNNKSTDLAIAQPFSISVKADDTVTISAQLLDSTGKPLFALTTLGVKVPVGTVPAVSINDSVLHIPQGVNYPIVALVTNADSIEWSSTSGIYDTIHKGNTLTGTWTDTLFAKWDTTVSDTIIITAYNHFGTKGNSDTVVIVAHPYKYNLVIDSFPQSVPIRKWITWKVTVTDIKNGTKVSDDSINYSWTITPPAVFDSIDTVHGTCRMFFADSVPPFQLSVVAYNGADSSGKKNEKITLRVWRPAIRLIDSITTAGIRESASFIIKAFDTNADGSVVSRYYKTTFGSGEPQQFTDDTVTITFTETNSQLIKFWCVDNDGFTSDTVPVRVAVTSNLPYFRSESDIDTSVFTGNTLRLTVDAQPGNGNSVITEYYWIFNHGDLIDTTTVDYYDFVRTEPGTETVEVHCKNSEDSLSVTPVTFSIRISRGYPVVHTVVCTSQTAFIGDSVDLAVSARDSNGTLTKLIVQSDNRPDDTIAIESPDTLFNDTLRVALSDTGSIRFAVVAIDNDDLSSALKSMANTLQVQLGRPAVRSMTPDSCWIYDDTLFEVNAEDSNASGSVASLNIQWETGAEWKTFTTLQPRHGYTSPGLKQVRIVAVDNQGYMSDTAAESVFVGEGRPSVIDSFPDTVWINDTNFYRVSGTDNNGSIRQCVIRWDGLEESRLQSNSLFQHPFTTAGPHTVEAFVIDDDSLPSDTISRTVQVNLGRPSITGVAAVNPGFASLYIGDEISFTVTVDDPNNENRMVHVSWNGDATFEDSVAVTDDRAVFTRKFNKTQSGEHEVRFRVFDKDNLTDDTSYSFTLLSGAPSVSPLSISPSVASIFVNDTITFRVRATDPNGNIRSIAINWNGGTSPQQTISFEGTLNTVDTSFTHAYDTLTESATINIWAVDEDTVSSLLLDTLIKVRKGAPVLWGDTLDTLWVVVDNGPSKEYPLLLSDNAYDTNGVNGKPVRYYINDGSTFDSTNVSAKKNNDGNFMWLVDEDRIDKNPKRIQFRVLDDDGFLSNEGSFWVFADSAPPRPATIITTTSNDSTIFKWAKVLDTKDGLKTQVQIYIKQGTSGEPDVPLFAEPWPSLDDPRFGEETISTLHATYKFKCSFSGIGWMRVVLRDARGTKTTAPNTAGDPTTFVAP